jgi:hypothetical protein
MPQVGFALTIPVLWRAKTVHALDPATVIGQESVGYAPLIDKM